MPLTAEQKRRKKVSAELEKLPLKTLKDYKDYNERARALGVPVKSAPAELHKTMTCKFLRRDGMTHPIKLKLRNEFIDFEERVEHGQVYDIPLIVIKHYQNLGVPKYRRVEDNKGNADTVFSHKEPRFAFQAVV